MNSWDLDPGKRSFNFKTNWDGGIAKDENGEEFYFMIAGGKDTKPTAENPCSTRSNAKRSFQIKRRSKSNP